MALKRVNLGEALKQLDVAVRAGSAAVAKTLAPGASPAVLARLVKTVGPVPAEVTDWFRWHDGQKGSISIGPSVNDRLLSAKAAADAWAFLEGESNKPWKSTWLPIMENGAGDYVCYDRANGSLIRYHHEDAMRPKAGSSLAGWAIEVASAWTATKASERPVAPPAGWTPTETPKATAFKKLPPGSAFYFRATCAPLGKGVFFHLFWKQKADTWFQSANSTLERCWTSVSNNLLPFQATPDRGMAYCLGKDRVFVDGKDAPHAGLFQQHFAKPPSGRA